MPREVREPFVLSGKVCDCHRQPPIFRSVSRELVQNRKNLLGNITSCTPASKPRKANSTVLAERRLTLDLENTTNLAQHHPASEEPGLGAVVIGARNLCPKVVLVHLVSIEVLPTSSTPSIDSVRKANNVSSTVVALPLS